jgi:hypothetical protein
MERVTLQELDGRGTNTWERVNEGHMRLDQWTIPLNLILCTGDPYYVLYTALLIS